jgi:hypothetical protein
MNIDATTIEACMRSVQELAPDGCGVRFSHDLLISPKGRKVERVTMLLKSDDVHIESDGENLSEALSGAVAQLAAYKSCSAAVLARVREHLRRDR